MFSEESDLDFGISTTKVSNRSQSVNIQRNDWGGVGVAGDLDPSLFPAKSIMDQFDSARGDFSEVGGAEVQNVYFDFDFEHNIFVCFSNFQILFFSLEYFIIFNIN